MSKNPQEWLNQADYDMETAEYIFSGKRYIYAVFMIHLAIEKALKGVFHKKRGEFPPKTHNLIYLAGECYLKPPKDIGLFLAKLNEASIVTRYPEDLSRIRGLYTETVTRDFIVKAKESLLWIKEQF